jgi:hypothetical protein
LKKYCEEGETEKKDTMPGTLEKRKTSQTVLLEKHTATHDNHAQTHTGVLEQLSKTIIPTPPHFTHSIMTC